MTSTPEDAGAAADPRLTAAVGIARQALLEVTPAHTIGEPAGSVVEPDGVVSLRFDTTLPGYPGWFWTVSVTVVDGDEPTVLEVELLPGPDALLAPDWVPWAVRLAEYQAQQAADEASDTDHDHGAGGDASDEADDDEDDSEDADGTGDDEDADDDEDVDESDDATPVFHSGDLDGVDIDELDESDQGDDDTDDADGGEDDTADDADTDD